MKNVSDAKFYKELYRRECAEVERLKKKIDEAELALRVWDQGGDSEYWLRHPLSR